MHPGDSLTRGTVWLALSLYVAAELATAMKPDARRTAIARWLNSLAAVVFLVHVACAFHFYHHWSHSAAYAETARRSAELSGWNSGAGLYLNYLFTLVWVAAVIWSWSNAAIHVRCARWIARAIRSFFLFMIFNGAVVFANGPMRWYGLILCAMLVTCWLRIWKRAADQAPKPKPA
jgi:hypothetical protein